MGNRIIVVDEHDTPIGLTTYPERRYQDNYRVTALWLTDRKTGDILLQQRNWTKHNDPGKWQCAASGTVEEGETYEENMVKEIEEEVGLSDLQLTEGPKTYINDGEHRFFCQWFAAHTDKTVAKVTIQQSELAAVRWVDKRTLLHELAVNPASYVPSMLRDMQILGIADKEENQPKTVIAIAKEDDWHEAQATGYYSKSTITSEFRDIGFLHCSLPDQTIGIANRHFLAYQRLVLLFIDPTKLRSPIKYEGALSGRPGIFPHIYGPLNTDAVYATTALSKGSSGEFDTPKKLEDLAITSE